MEEEINLLDYWQILKKRRRLIILAVGIVTSVSIVYSLLAPKFYRAEAALMPVGGSGSGAAMAAALQQIPFAGLLGGIGVTGTTSQLMAILKSRTMAERIIEKLDLMKVYFPKGWNKKEETQVLEETIHAFHEDTTFIEDKKTQLITINSIARDPEIAAEIANSTIDELGAYLIEGAFTTSKRNRIFLERQLEKNKVQLLEAGKELANFYQKEGVSSSESLIDVHINAEGGDIPLSQRMEKLQREHANLEQKIEEVRLVKQVPQQVYLQYLTRRRELLAQINALLTQEYEMAKITEAKEDLSFSVIDWARVPQTRYKPQRTKIVIASFMLSLFLATFVAFFLDYLEKIRQRQPSAPP